MSDYMYLLESLLNREQYQLLTEVQNAAAEVGVALYLTGGAMRDMLGGFPIRDLDFTFEEQPPAKLAKAVSKRLETIEIDDDPVHKIAELRLPSGVTGSLRMAHVGKVSKPGGTPKTAPAHLLEDLAKRDFTVNAIAISLAKASRGLIRDPMNGQSDLENRFIRVCYSGAFFDEPVRLIRAVRFCRRMSFQIEQRTQGYFQNAIDEGWHATLTPEDWHRELRLISEENEPSEVLRDLATARLLPVPLETLNMEGLQKFEKLRRMIPGRAPHWTLFLHVATEHMKPRDRTAFAEALGLDKADLEAAKKLKPKVAKLEADVKSPGLRKPSQVYNALSTADPAELLLLFYESDAKPVQERITTYLEKYLPMANEITDAQVEATGAKPGTPQFAKAKAGLITAALNAPPPEPPPEPVAPGPPGNTSSPQFRGRIAR